MKHATHHRRFQRLRAAMERSHDDFLPGGVVGDVVDLLLLIWDPLHRLHDFLEHGSLPGRQEIGRIMTKVKTPNVEESMLLT